MRVHTETEKCVAAGVCVLAAPEVFDQDDDGLVVVLDDSPQSEQREVVLDAAARCPAAVIRLDEDA
ncbi:ferredoxin [Streptomyces sp. L-9-10]|uniref:ferredoxin n=1 Tax=Streptomyces sp. L-9-10 TaxID=1478131 RepID=UPI00101BC58B|nr:ferredoxin [Streptomyces sp. L-9-10]RYJ28363.1 ferredoxin [Streptomyces sp. L-9-10]